ncbi:uncharacterized protein E0L32_004391 [Thyridium curvatum]|uniref:Uncharacterized protein n=1 Tax=Thyridium curvatum TaxID=1093900 RepID=A0A507BEM6_9PEZI|nr:uncharacterized protein E0L32_004391 [Thyridium curvatum]TPX15411.1 hypothetical protein E0L32_004391 [Thyridium curvatum]
MSSLGQVKEAYNNKAEELETEMAKAKAGALALQESVERGVTSTQADTREEWAELGSQNSEMAEIVEALTDELFELSRQLKALGEDREHSFNNILVDSVAIQSLTSAANEAMVKAIEALESS